MNSKSFALSLSTLVAVPAFAGAPACNQEMTSKGAASYKTNCAVCHGDRGDGAGPAAASLNPKARNFITEKFKLGGKPEQVFKTISEGSKNTSMAAFGHLKEDERWALTCYVLSLKKK